MELANKNSGGKFKYGAIDGSLIIAVHEKPLFNSTTSLNSCPTLTILLRGPFTCQAWTLHLRNTPFSKTVEEPKPFHVANEHQPAFKNPGSSLKRLQQEPGFCHGKTAFDNGMDASPQQKHVPKCEQSIPSLSDVSSVWVKNLAKFQTIKEEQIKFEMAATGRVSQLINQKIKKT